MIKYLTEHYTTWVQQLHLSIFKRYKFSSEEILKNSLEFGVVSKFC